MEHDTLNSECVTRCVNAMVRIDNYLQANQINGAYDRWLERYEMKPGEHDDAFLFGKLVQAMFSGGMNGETVDDWMSRMEEAFHGWDVRWIASLSDKSIEKIGASGKVINHPGKLKAVVPNAKRVVALIEQYSSFGKYLESIAVQDLRLKLRRFDWLGESTVEDFLRNVGFDTAKPDRHLTRWLQRMRAIDKGVFPEQVLALASIIAEAAKFSRAKFDSAIYLFCANRHDVILHGVCGKRPDCIECAINDLCSQFYRDFIGISIRRGKRKPREISREMGKEQCITGLAGIGQKLDLQKAAFCPVQSLPGLFSARAADDGAGIKTHLYQPVSDWIT